MPDLVRLEQRLHELNQAIRKKEAHPPSWYHLRIAEAREILGDHVRIYVHEFPEGQAGLLVYYEKRVLPKILIQEVAHLEELTKSGPVVRVSRYGLGHIEEPELPALEPEQDRSRYELLFEDD